MTDTDAATIPQLLEELKEVNFETWNTINIRCRFIETSYETEFGQDFIQGCIQRAIHEQKCALQQFHFMGSADYCNAAIFSIREMIAEGNGATPTTALLAAYIEAKRASK